MGRTLSSLEEILTFVHLNPSKSLRVVREEDIVNIPPTDRTTSYISVHRVTNEIFLARRRPYAQIFILRTLNSHTDSIEEFHVSFDSFHSSYVLFAIDSNVMNRFLINNHILDNVMNKVHCDDSR